MTRLIKDKGQAPVNKPSPPNLNAGFGITKEDIARTIDTNYVIDCNKKTSAQGKPRFTK